MLGLAARPAAGALPPEPPARLGGEGEPNKSCPKEKEKDGEKEEESASAAMAGSSSNLAP